MNGPVRLPSESDIIPAVNRSGSTLRKNAIVGYGTQDVSGETALDSLHSAGVGMIAGAIQHAVDDDDSIDLFTAGDLVLESDGTGTITAGKKVYAIAGGSLAAGGRVKQLPDSPTPGTNYPVVGRALTSAAASAGAEVVVRWSIETYQG